MTPMTRALWLFMVCAALVPSPRASAEPAIAYLERDPIRADETVRLIIETEETVAGQLPDLRPLQRDFRVRGTSTSTQIKLINGKQITKTQWIVELEPTREGTLTIPSLAVGRLKTPTLGLKVLPATAQADAGSQDVFLEVEVDRTDPYVQSQLLYTVRLLLAVDIIDGSLSEPQINNALVERLGKDASFEALRGARRYRVIERRYAVFPQVSGVLMIEPMRFVGQIVDRSKQRSMFDGFFDRGKSIRARSSSIQLTVRPQPNGYAGVWLPARELTLEEAWSTQPPVFRVGEPITRTLTLRALGLGGAQLPELPASSVAALKIYPDQPTTDSNQQGNWVTGIRQERQALVPSETGRVELPAIRIPWWDVNANKRKEAVIPGRVVTVAAADGASPVSAVNVRGEGGATAREQPAHASATRIWQVTSVVLCVGWIVTLLAWYRRIHHKQRVVTGPALDIAPERRCRRRLRDACLGHDMRGAKTALLDWARLRWRADPPCSLGAIAARLDNPLLTGAIRDLDHALYCAPPMNWDGAQLWATVEPLMGRDGPRAARPPLLPDLVPGRR